MSTVVEKKAEVVSRLADILKDSDLSVVIDFKGLNVSTIDTIRSNLNQANFKMEVTKNTLLKRASDQVGLSFDDSVFFSCSAVISGEGDGLALAKMVDKYSGEYESFKVKAGVFENQVCDSVALEALSKLPSKEELISKLLMLINSPISNFVQGVSTPIRKFAYVLDAIGHKKIKEENND